MNNFLVSIKNKIIQNKWLLSLVIFYFIFRLINLTKLPVFNDESIYLDWGYREIHIPGFLYYSLYDAKQPLLMWAFGIFESVFSNPLFGGRFVSVTAGFITLLGIYKLSKYLFSEKVGLASVFLYSIIPVFSFFDRQALMESSISAIGIWSGYFFLKNISAYKNSRAIILGIIFGVGFFIKSTALAFLFSYLSLSIFLFLISKNKGKNAGNTFLTIVAFFLTAFFLFINPLFWQTFPTNSRYSLTAAEILSFPFKTWISNLYSNFSIAFLFITPLVFLMGIAGVIKIFHEKKLTKTIFLLFFIIPLFFNTILIRVPSDRYLTSFLPFLVIPFAYYTFELYRKNKNYFLFIFIAILFPLVLTLFQVTNPKEYIFFTSKFTSLNDLPYVEGQTSGYGINETITFFNSLSNEKIIIGTGENTGNPESAMFVFFNKNKNISVTYFDNRLLGQNLSGYDCVSTGLPTYFVSRDEQLVGIDRFLQKLKTIQKPFDKSSIGIYKLKDKCKGKTMELKLQDNR